MGRPDSLTLPPPPGSVCPADEGLGFLARPLHVVPPSRVRGIAKHLAARTPEAHCLGLNSESAACRSRGLGQVTAPCLISVSERCRWGAARVPAQVSALPLRGCKAQGANFSFLSQTQLGANGNDPRGALSELAPPTCQSGMRQHVFIGLQGKHPANVAPIDGGTQAKFMSSLNCGQTSYSCFSSDPWGWGGTAHGLKCPGLV